MDGESRDRIIILDRDLSVSSVVEAEAPCVLVKTLAELQDRMQSLVEPKALLIDMQIGDISEQEKLVSEFKIKWPLCPVIMLSGAEADVALLGQALASGADDFCERESEDLLYRMRARIEGLSKKANQDVIHLADLTINLTRRAVANKNGVSRNLSPTEINLLRTLIEGLGTVIRRDVIKRKCWGDVPVSDNALNRKLHEVRHVLRDLSSQVSIKTVYGTGFSLEVKPLDS